ncbi:MAG: alpha-mannosidase [Chloroflexota bacterium]|nr:alpha-mannosidase [Chloroflexota bacterium]
MVFLVQKLQRSLEALQRAIQGPSTALAPIYSSVASGPMTMPEEEASWKQIETGQFWGERYGTSWLKTTAHVPAAQQGEPLVLQLHWDRRNQDELLRYLEATVFLDGRACGAFDWRHPVLLLPAAVSDGAEHELLLQVFTEFPHPFGGLTIHIRSEVHWQLYHLMETVLHACLSLHEGDPVRHALLERLNNAYNMLDLREGWHSERFIPSAQAAYNYLQAHLTEGLTSGNRPQITVSGHAHLDVAWQWPYWRTRQKIAHTVANVLALMDRYPDYHYSQSQPQVLQWLKEDVPELYARVKERVAEGRFEPVGAMWLEADCNLPSGESLVRQILHGTRFLQEEFGMTVQHIWLPDVFGYSAALPQIMRDCNIPVFMTTKISWNQFNRMPCDTFRWRGIDGTEVLTHFITAPDLHSGTTYYTYNGPMRPEDMTGTWDNYRQQDINDRLLYLAGWGDGGGGPTEEQLERVQILADLPGFPQVRSGRADTFFKELYARVWENPRLPTWVGELYLEYHRGTYTSQARNKQANRRAELAYRETELLNAWASLYGMPSRQEQLNEGWRIILLNQFHDVLPGSSIHEVYEDTERLYAHAFSIAQAIRDEALATLQQHIAASEQDIIVLNSLLWERTDPLQLPASSTRHIPGAQSATDWDGNTLLLIDSIRVPASGITVLAMDDGTRNSEPQAFCRASFQDDQTLLLQNAFYDLQFDSHGNISRLYDKCADRDVLAEGQVGNQLIAYEDRPLNFDAWDIDLFYEEKAYPLSAHSAFRILEEGPIRATVEIVREYLSSRITQRISLWRSSPRIDIATEIDWHEHQTLLKAAFPLAINSTRATYEIQFGSVERPTHRNTSWDLARFEVCAHRWIDLSEGGYGVSLLNDSKYGHDVHDNIMRLTLLKSGIYPDAQADQGIHRFTYSLLPHVGDWRGAQTVRHAYELNVPLIALPGQAQSPASPGASGSSFIQTDCSHVVVETVKPAEDRNGLIVRLYEAHNQRGGGTLSFATRLRSVQACNLLEEPLADIAVQGNSFSFEVKPFEIKTFRVHPSL